LLAPLEALLRRCASAPRVELDSDRLEEAASAISFDLPAATPSAGACDRGQSDTNGLRDHWFLKVSGFCAARAPSI
jgi:hypothetical protein